MVHRKKGACCSGVDADGGRFLRKIGVVILRGSALLVGVKPRYKLDEATTVGGDKLALFEQDGMYSISCNGQELMHSKANASELLLGEVGVAKIQAGNAARVLVGGLGLGFTLQAALEKTGSDTTVEVVELLPEVVEWNRSHLKDLNDAAVEDPRVEVRVMDAGKLIREAKPQTYDSIMLDLDNGPVAMVAKENASMYSVEGIRRINTILKPKGRVVFWSAGKDPKFANRLSRNGFRVKAVPAKVHERAKRAAYMLYVGDKI